MHSQVEVVRFPGAHFMLLPGEQPEVDDFVVEDAWGITVDSVEVTPEFSQGESITGILDLSGEWWCVAKAAGGRRLVFSDRFGIQPLAFAAADTIDGPSLFVGTSSAATARAIRAAGGSLHTNWSYMLETIGAKHDFLDCIFDFSTPTDEVKWLPPDRAVEVGPDGFRIVPRPTIRERGTYESLLQAGIDRAIDDVRRLCDSHERVAINLSGGKDSRVVLSLVLAAGRQDQVHVAATDPTPPGGSIAHSTTVQRDLEISSRLVRGLGLRWVEWRSPRDIWPTSLEGELHTFQRLRHGLTNQFLPLGLTYRLTEPEARINGAGGEIYREYWSHVLAKHPVWRQLEKSVGSMEADATRLLRSLRGPITIPHELAERGEFDFVEGLAHISNGSLAEALDRHYEYFRMRGHAGGRRWGQSYGITNFSLLQQSTLSRAGLELEPAEQRGGKLLFDIVERLAPELHDLEYQSGPWPWSCRRPLRRDWSGVADDVAGYRKAQQNAAKSSVPSGYRGRPRPDMSEAIATGLRSLGEQLRADGWDPSLISPIAANQPTDLRGQGRMLARLFNWASAFDDERLCPVAMAAAPPMVRTYSHATESSQ